MTEPPEFDFISSAIAPGLSVIEASAGTGKTYAISHLVPRLLLDGTIAHLAEVLLVTFTNDAARELSDRVRKVLEQLHAPPVENEQKLAPGVFRLRHEFDESTRRRIIGRALLDVDRLGVSTIHSFCQRTLQTEGTLCGLPVVPDLIPNADAIIEEVLFDLWNTRLTSDELVSAIASAQRWDLADDLRFVKLAMSLENIVPEPAVIPFQDLLARLENAPADFTDEVCQELEDLFQKVGKWNAKAPGASERALLVKNLRETTSVSAPGFLTAVEQLSGIGEWINIQSAAGKALQTDAKNLAAVKRAREISERLADLSWSWKNECVGQVHEAVESKLRAHRQITYDGLILALRDALRSETRQELAGNLRKRYKIALIDESQDTDPRQFEIFRNIFLGFSGEKPLPGHRLVLIGDPKQAIYSFRGADVNTYLAARKQAGTQVFRLHETFRAPAPLVSAINVIFSRDQALLKEGLAFFPATSGLKNNVQLRVGDEIETASLEAWIVPDADGAAYSKKENRNRLVAEMVAAKIALLLRERSSIVHTEPDGTVSNEHAVQPGDFAVLVSDRYEAAAIAEALRARRIPAIQANGNDILMSDEASELLTLLRAINEPRRSGLRFAALATRLLGRDDAAIRALRDDSVKDDEMLAKFVRWEAALDHQGVAQLLAQIDREEGIMLRIAGTEHGERRVTNLRQLTDLLQAQSMKLGGRPEHLLRWFGQEITRAEDRNETEERQQQLESDSEAVQIVTMHAAKGLEYNLVFCPFLWTNRETKGYAKLPVSEHSTRLVDVKRNPAFESALAQLALEDRLRLAYVALTRARVRVWLCGGELSGNHAPPSALDWLLRSDTSLDFESWSAAFVAAGRGSRHAAGLDALIAESSAQAAVARRDLSGTEAGAEWSARHATRLVLAPLPLPIVPDPWGVTSFSSLTREKHAHGESNVPPASPAPAMLSAQDGGKPNPFLGAPGGTLVGTAVHDWIETWDFSEPDTEALRHHLEKFHIPQPAAARPLHELVAPMLEDLRGAVLPGLGCTVAEAAPDPAGSEWHFHLPINETLGSQRLAAAFREHSDDQSYAAMLETLPSGELAGYLQGFLDRVVFYAGQWGVIDWKTNRLGDEPAAYGHDLLLQSARHSHYLLQTHLYLVALRRYLGPNVPIAGAWLVFLRGIQAGSSNGILHIKPPAALLTAIDQLFTPPR